jgi:hypothetical protein
VGRKDRPEEGQDREASASAMTRHSAGSLALPGPGGLPTNFPGTECTAQPRDVGICAGGSP